MLLFISFSSFAFIISCAYCVYFFFFQAENQTVTQLKKLDVRDEQAPAPERKLRVKLVQTTEQFIAPLMKSMPVSAVKLKKLEVKLAQAGYRSIEAPQIYRGIQTFFLLAPPIVTWVIMSIIGYPENLCFAAAVLALFFGYVLPRHALDRLIIKRQERLRYGLTDALDLLVVSIEAGLGLNAALVRVSEELKDVHPDVSEEFQLANMEILVGRPREEALRNLGDRTQVEDLRALCAMLIQTDRFGTSIAQALRIFAQSMRTRRRQLAEQAAQKAAVKLLLPLAAFLFPTLFIIILGPAVLQLMDKFYN